MDAWKVFRQDLMRGAKIQLMSRGLKPTNQAARKLVDREVKRLKELQKFGATAPQGVTHAV